MYAVAYLVLVGLVGSKRVEANRYFHKGSLVPWRYTASDTFCSMSILPISYNQAIDSEGLLDIIAFACVEDIILSSRQCDSALDGQSLKEVCTIEALYSLFID